MDKVSQAENSRVREGFVEINGARLHFVDEGPIDAPAVMFSHSIMTHAGMWDKQAEFLKDEYRIVRYDARGHGQSTLGPDQVSTALLATDAVAILDALKIHKVHFVGLSLGGIVGFDLALHYAERLLSLVICDARADSSDDFARPWDARIETAQHQGMDALGESTMQRWFGSDFLQTAAAEEVRSMIKSTSVEGFIGTARAIQSFDYRQVTATTIGRRVTLTVGERDGVLPAVMESLAAKIENAKLEVIAAAGHLPNLENSSDFNLALLRHLKSNGRRA